MPSEESPKRKLEIERLLVTVVITGTTICTVAKYLAYEVYNVVEWCQHLVQRVG